MQSEGRAAMSGDGILKMCHNRNLVSKQLRFQLDKESQWWFSCGVYERCAQCQDHTPQILDYRTIYLVCERCGSETRIPSIAEMAQLKKTWDDYWNLEKNREDAERRESGDDQAAGTRL